MLRVGIIGCGAIAEEMHIPCLRSMTEVKLVALVDRDRLRSEQLARQSGAGVKACDLAGLRDLVDAVIIATPPDVRPVIVEQVASLGLHILCEKPMANDLAGCRRIIDAARSAGVVLAVGHMFRFYPVRRHLPDILRKHDLGRILSFEVTEGKPYAWKSRTGYTFLREMVSGGVLLNAGVHSLDSLLWWFGDPVDVQYRDDAIGGLESNAELRLSFAGGEKGLFRISRTGVLPYRFRFRAERGSLDFAVPSLSRYEITISGKTDEYVWGNASPDPIDCWRAQMQDFADAIRLHRKPLVNGEEGARVMAIVDQCYAAKRARPLPAKALQPGAMW